LWSDGNAANGLSAGYPGNGTERTLSNWGKMVSDGRIVNEERNRKRLAGSIQGEY